MVSEPAWYASDFPSHAQARLSADELVTGLMQLPGSAFLFCCSPQTRAGEGAILWMMMARVLYGIYRVFGV